MKKTLYLIITFILCLSLCACGNKEGESITHKTTTPPVVKAKVKETVSTNLFNCTLTRAEFTDTVSFSEGLDYLLPSDGSHLKQMTSKNGYKLLSFTFELTYHGKKELKLGLGSPKVMDLMVMYDNDYAYESFTISGSTQPEGMWHRAYTLDSTSHMVGLSNSAFDFSPLDETVHEFRAYITVPNMVAESTDKPVDIIISLCEEDIIFTVN